MLIAFEGIDGSGKGTQASHLAGRARAEGLAVAEFSFPRYGRTPFAETIGRYLNGEFGALDEVPAEFAALLYAGDRLATKPALDEALATCDLVICDRYVPSNLAHQAAKLPPERRPAFIDWLSGIEHGVYDLPRADLVLLLDLPSEVAADLVRRKKQRDYTDLSEDLHEADHAYLAACRALYHELAVAEPDRWTIVPGLDEAGALRTEADIAERIWGLVTARAAATA